MNLFASDCAQFPNQSGPFSRDVYVGGLLVKVKAQFTINKGTEFGKDYTSHTFRSPEFIVDGKRVSVDAGSATQIFNQLCYSWLSYKVIQKAGFFDRGLILDSDLRVRKINPGEYFLNDSSPIGVYRPVCSNWQY